MSHATPPSPQSHSSTRDTLAELARLLREVDHIEPEARDELAALVDELVATLHGEVALEQSSHLAQSAAELVRALHEQQGHAPLASARERLEEAAARAEVDAPVATGVVRRLIDLLADLGI